uniref:DAN domain family, member 5 n=1 Tax=Hucho hucho TaxID=62062 RepID=A0A4W5Q5D9_9TELE
MMFAAEVTGVIFILVYKDLVEVTIRGASKDSLQMSYMGPTAADPISTAWNTIMVHYKCCGFDNSTADFKNSVFSANSGLLYPKTCCVDLTSTACDGLDTTQGLIHPKSCITKLINVIQDQSVIFGSTASGICVMESIPKNGARRDFESSGNGPVDEQEPIRGTVKVVKLNPNNLGQSGLFRRGGIFPRGAPGPRIPFPAFLSMGRPGPPALPAKAAAVPLHPLSHLHNDGQGNGGVGMKKRQGFEMWQRAMDKSDHSKTMSMSLPLSLKDSANRQSCAAVPFTQRIMSEGCDTVMVHNKLCFGQCSSLFVPSGWESARLTDAGGHRRAPCSRCAPSKAHTVTVPLRCGMEVREKRVMVVEECKCETGREEGNIEGVASMHL